MVDPTKEGSVVDLDPQPTASLAEEARMSIEDIEGEREQIAIAVERPNKQRFFRVHPDPDLIFNAGILLFQEETGDRISYLVLRGMYPKMEGDAALKMLFPYIDDTGAYGLWPVAAPSPSGGARDWTKAAIAAAKLARADWIRLKPVRSRNTYEIITNTVERADPDWPRWGVDEWLERAFPDEQVIRNEEHPVYQKLYTGGVA